MRSADASLAFMREVYEDRDMAIKRSGRLDCVEFLWQHQRCDQRIASNKSIFTDWMVDAINGHNMSVVRWLLGKTLYARKDWFLLATCTADMLTQEGHGEEALALATNANGSWWNAAAYAEHFYHPDRLIYVATSFMLYRRHDLFMRLVSKAHWPGGTDMGALTRYYLSIIAAIRTESAASFDAWWKSETCVQLFAASEPERTQEMDSKTILGGILWHMLQSPAISSQMAALRMIMVVAEYVGE
jgi:hypothetical protein